MHEAKTDRTETWNRQIHNYGCEDFHTSFLVFDETNWQ